MNQTLSQLLVESDDALNRRLAELDGYQVSGWVPSYNDPDNAGLAPEAEPFPNYCDPKHGHNAVAEVRSGLHGNAHPSATTDKEKAYRDALCRVVGCAWYQSAKLLCATPREHTIALILALSDQ